MGTEYLDISNCPKCHRQHRYKIKVDRAIVLNAFPGLNEDDERLRQIKFTRLFTCPDTNEEFEAMLVMTDTSSNRIIEVAVIGVTDDEHL